MVNRGWVYSPDARVVDLARWRERDSAAVSGFAETYSGGRRGDAVSSRSSADSARTRAVYALDRQAIETTVGLPVAPYVLVQTSDSASHPDSVPARLAFPALGEGPHRSYAIQWFSFAVVAVVGGGVLFRKEKNRAA